MTTLEPCLGPAQLQMYLAVCLMADRGEHITARSLLRHTATRNYSRVGRMLHLLQKAGLIAFAVGRTVRGRNGIVPGSIRPLRRVELFTPECFGCPATS